MALVFEAAARAGAGPAVLVRDRVAVLGGDVDSQVREGAGDLVRPVRG